MRKYVVAVTVGLVGAAVLLLASFAIAGHGSKNVRAHGGLIGFQEVPAISTTGGGTFRAKVNRDNTAFDWTLTYEALQGTVTQAHIHFGQRSVNGGISVWLCGTATNPGPPGTQTCPSPPATVSGTATAADVVGPSAQGIAPGEFAELLSAIRAGKTYANVHSTTWPGGEIRGQLNDRSDDD